MAKGTNLVIVESPSKAKTIGKYLGPEYRVEACMGHLRDLPKSTMGVDIEADFAPEYIDENDRPHSLENGYKTSLATHLYVLPYLRLQNRGCVRILCEDVQFSQ